MQLTEIRVKSFRSIETEQMLSLPSGVTLVGPNSSGKTNALRAVKMLFTGPNNSYGYSRANDFPFGQKGRTSITGTFLLDDSLDDLLISDELDELHHLLGTKRSTSLFNLTVYFTEQSKPVYLLFPNSRRPTDTSDNAKYSRIHTALVAKIIGSFQINYIPSAKSIPQLYEELLTPWIRKRIANRLSLHANVVTKELEDIAVAVNSPLKEAGSNLKASFGIPFGSIEKMLSSFDFMLTDNQTTSITEKGMGIQALALQAALCWVSSEQQAAGKNVVWLLEEPESYLHPELVGITVKMLNTLSQTSTVVCTTHSLGFVPQNPSMVKGIVRDGHGPTEIVSYKTYIDATTKIRANLGVRFSDYYSFAEFNVLVEGPSDRETYKWLLESVPTAERAWPSLRKANFLDFGGVSNLGGFLRASFPMVRDERAVVVVLDGDDAGDKVRRDLQHYFGNTGTQFHSGSDFILIRDRFAIEGLFPDEWIVNIHGLNPKFIKDFSLDSAGSLMPFNVPDDYKSSVLDYLRETARHESDYVWAERFFALFDIIDGALTKHADRLQRGLQSAS